MKLEAVGPQHDTIEHRKRSAECPMCHRHNMRRRANDYYCRTCCEKVPLDKVVWRDKKPEGSGIIAGPRYQREFRAKGKAR